MIINDNKLAFKLLRRALLDENIVFTFEYMGKYDEVYNEQVFTDMKNNLLRYIELMLLDDIKISSNIDEILELTELIFNKLPYLSFMQGIIEFTIFLSEDSRKLIDRDDIHGTIMTKLPIEKMISFNGKFYAKETPKINDCFDRPNIDKLKLFTFSFYYENNENYAITESFENIINSMALLNGD